MAEIEESRNFSNIVPTGQRTLSLPPDIVKDRTTSKLQHQSLVQTFLQVIPKQSFGLEEEVVIYGRNSTILAKGNFNLNKNTLAKILFSQVILKMAKTTLLFWVNLGKDTRLQLTSFY